MALLVLMLVVVDYYVSKNGVYGYGGSVGGDIFVNVPQSTWATMSIPQL